MDETAASKVDHLYFASRVAFNQNVLWLEIAMDQPKTMDELEGSQYLLCN